MDSFNSKKRVPDEFFLTSDATNIKKILPDNSFEKENTEENRIKIDANQAIFVRFVSEPADMLAGFDGAFHPEFTNQIFGEDEQISGYEDLKINIYFMANQFYANIDISYTKKEEGADDIYELFDEVFQGGYYKEKSEFIKNFPQEKTFKPLGKLINTFKINDHTYEIFYCDFSTEGFAEYNFRLQIVLFFFINGASFIEEDHKWKIYLLYKHQQNYNLVGFSTVYSFFQDLNKCRYRISQFITLPPFQRKGLGMYLISEIYADALKDKTCFEITVEDSSIGFQFLRDCKDFELLMNEECFNWIDQIKEKFQTNLYLESKIKLGKDVLKELKKKYKLTKNQIRRVIEIMKFVHLNKSDEAFALFKEEVKERLKQANKSEFYPFVNKKIPYVAFDGYQAIINPAIYKNLNEIEVQAKLEEYFEEMVSQYSEIKLKILKIISTRKKQNR